MALNDPEMFLQIHKWPLIIDEVQYAPGLFEVIEAIVNKVKFETLKKKTNYQVDKCCVICNTPKIYSLKENVFVLPLSAI